MEESVRFIISYNIPSLTWKNRKFTVAKIREDDSTFRK